MPEIRKFGDQTRQPVPVADVVGVRGTVIQLPRDVLAGSTPDALVAKYGGMPFLLEPRIAIIALTIDPHGEIHEHDAPHPILMLVTGGRGFVRLGGPDGETIAVAAGDAVLWPPHVLHKAWTTDEPLQLISIEYPPEQAQ